MMTDSQTAVSPIVETEARQCPASMRCNYGHQAPLLNAPPTRLISSCRSDRRRRRRQNVPLRLGPAAENVVDREQFDLGEGVFVLLGDLGVARTGRNCARRSPGPRLVYHTGDRRRRRCACPFCRQRLSTIATGGSARIDCGGAHDLELRRSKLLQGEERLVLPGEAGRPRRRAR